MEEQKCFRIWLFGPLHVEQKQADATWKEIPVKWERQADHLLRYLLCTPKRRARRGTLIEALFPDSDDVLAEGYLRRMVQHLRPLFGNQAERFLFTYGGDARHCIGYALADSSVLWTDLDEVKACIHKATIRGGANDDALCWLEQIDLFLDRGEFLENESGEWSFSLSMDIQDSVNQCRQWLIEIYERQGKFQQAREQLHKLLAANPDDEDIEQYGKTMRQHISRRSLRTSSLLSAPTIFLASQEKDEALSLQGSEDTLQLPDWIDTLSSGQGVFTSSESGVLVPLALATQMLSLETASLDVATWLAARISELKAYGAFWHEPTITCQQQQAFIHAEIENWSTMTDQDSRSTSEYHITRRMALATLATLSSSLLAKVQLGPLTTLLIEEFLAESATSITACYHLLSGDGLATVEYALPKYLPVLTSLAQQSSSYQRRAAYLASQGYWVMGIVALHRLLFKNRVAYGKQSVEFARLSGDRTELVMMLTSLGNAWYNVAQQAEMTQKQQEMTVAYAQMLQAYQEATHIIAETPDEVPSVLHSKVFAGLAHTSAQQGMSQEAFRWIGEARAVFSEEQRDLPGFLSMDYGIYQVILFEGLTFLDLGKNTSKGDHNEQAWLKLEQIEQLHTTVKIPERIRIEIINQRALAAIRTGRLDEFKMYFIKGTQGANALQSQKRRQEAIANWKEARELWPHEKRIVNLADVLF